MRKTWETIREVMKTKKAKDEIPKTFSENGKLLSNLNDITDGFNNFFASIGPALASKIPEPALSYQTFLKDPEEDNFQFSRVTPSKLIEICGKLKPKASSGADYISTKLLKRIIYVIINVYI